MILVFSDEFNSKWRDFGPGKDAKWQALDLHYVNDDLAMFRKSAVSVHHGSAHITASRTSSKGPFSALWGDQLSEKEYTSGMLQGWNKFCFTGGYLEARLKLPGDDSHGGLWPAIFTLGNLGRAGYLRSTEGVWPWSYDTCDTNALDQQEWSDHKGQRINRCNSTLGRGASEIDLLEVGVWQATKPQLSTSMHIAPILPMGLHWLDNEGGTYFPTYADPSLYSAPNGWAGVNSFVGPVKGVEGEVFRPRPGTRLADAMSATHNLNATHFSDFYVYAFDWAPRRYVRWYLNGILIYELNSIALKGATNGDNKTVGDRLIPVDPQYININLAMSNSFAQISPDLPLPATMEIDYIRVYQPRSDINVGCDRPDYPSQAYINANVNKYKITLEGFEDYVGDSRVIGPTMEPQAEKTDYAPILIGVCVSIGCSLIIAGAVGYWLWRRKKAREQEAADMEANGGKPLPPKPKPVEEEPTQRNWIVRLAMSLWIGPASNTRGRQMPQKPPTTRVKVVPVMVS